jgi:CheY-like chemotaxis protein
MIATTGSARRAEALSAVSQHPPNLIISDYQMPIMSGLELLRTLRAQGMTMPILVLSSDTSMAGAILAAGATAVLPKPFRVRVCGNCCARYCPLMRKSKLWASDDPAVPMRSALLRPRGSPDLARAAWVAPTANDHGLSILLGPCGCHCTMVGYAAPARAASHRAGPGIGPAAFARRAALGEDRRGVMAL